MGAGPRTDLQTFGVVGRVSYAQLPIPPNPLVGRDEDVIAEVLDLAAELADAQL